MTSHVRLFLSSHHLEEIEDLLEDVLLIKDGKNHLQIPISELKEWAIAIKGNKWRTFLMLIGRKAIEKGDQDFIDQRKEVIFQKEVGVNTHVYSCEK